MTLAETVLQRVAEWRPSAGGRDRLAVAGGGWAVELTADANNEIGCRAWEVTLRSTGPRGEITLEEWARRSAERVKSLIEPLAVVEVDAPRGEALLRSGPPTTRGDDVSYYEVLLRGTEQATVRRFQGRHQPGHRREQVPVALTHDALARLVGDLAGE